MKLTKNFSREEFDCKCGCEMPSDVLANVRKLSKGLQNLRNEVGAITITSGYRCPEHNKKIGGAKNSQHIYGNAADIKVKGYTPSEVIAVIKRLIKEGKMREGGIGKYSSWTHYDRRGNKARW